MVKLVIVHQTPEDPEAFESQFTENHAPRVKRLPGLRRLEVARVTGTPIGTPKLYLLEELYFDDEESMQRALASADGRELALELAESAKNSAVVFYAQIETP